MSTMPSSPIWRPWQLERGLLCRNLGWEILPDELDEKSLVLSQVWEALFVFDSFRLYANDLEQLNDNQLDIIHAVEKLRDAMRK